MASPSELKEFLSQRGPVPLMDLAHHFHKEPEVIRDRLDHWVRKGKVRLTKANVACQSQCCGCGPGPAELCEWVETTHTSQPATGS